jgi:hypothetical protein
MADGPDGPCKLILSTMDRGLLFPLPGEAQQQLEDVDEVEVERQAPNTAILLLASWPKPSAYCSLIDCVS